MHQLMHFSVVSGLPGLCKKKANQEAKNKSKNEPDTKNPLSQILSIAKHISILIK